MNSLKSVASDVVEGMRGEGEVRALIGCVWAVGEKVAMEPSKLWRASSFLIYGKHMYKPGLIYFICTCDSLTHLATRPSPAESSKFIRYSSAICIKPPHTFL